MPKRKANLEVDPHWDELASLLQRRSGLVFAGARMEAFSARVREHLEARRIKDLDELMRLLRGSGIEYESLLDRLLAFPCDFFRLPQVFRAFEQRVLPEMHMKKFWDKPRSLRLWSAGCGSGEEPYSIAVSIADAIDVAESWHIHLLATDISQQALQHAERGVYSRAALSALSPEQIENYFMRAGDMFMVRPRLRKLVAFVRTNLADASYAGRFDCIFCIDVLDYFAQDRRVHMVQRFFDCLEPGGYLFVGSADRISESPVPFETVTSEGITLYQKPAGGATGRNYAASGATA
jgi:chemotaxis methyl-accepting protein methylase